MSSTNNVIVHYAIIDNDDGSASLRLLQTKAALDAYLEWAEQNDERDLSEGGRTLTVNAVANAMSMDAVQALIDGADE